jgi:hypothetical protein
LSTSEADELGRTAPIDVPAEPASPPSAPPVEDGEHPPPAEPEAHAVIAPAPVPATPEMVYVPLAITIGDGFKFGCGFFLAMVLVMLVGFVLLAALFLLTSLLGLNLPITR